MTASTIPVLETERLILRELREDDFRFERDFLGTGAARFIGGPMKPHQVWRNMAMILGHWMLRGFGFWAIEDKATGTYQGRAGLWYPHGWYGREIAWTLMPHGQGKGYATEAGLRARAHAYEVLGWDGAISQIDPQNTASKAVAKRLGAVFETTYDDPEYGPVEVWRHPFPEKTLQGGAQ